MGNIENETQITLHNYQRQLYNNIWEKVPDSDEHILPSDKLKNEIIYKFIDFNDHQKILDIGSGKGLMWSNFSRRNINIIGIDISISGLKKARGNINEGVFIQTDAQKLPFKDGSFDIVICKDLLEHVPSDDSVLNEAHRVLRKKGKLILFLPIKSKISFEGFMEKLLGYNYIDKGSGHLRRYEDKILLSKLELKNFKISSHTYYAHWFVSLTDLFFIFIIHHVLIKFRKSESKIMIILNDILLSLLVKLSYIIKYMDKIEYILFKRFSFASGMFIVIKK